MSARERTLGRGSPASPQAVQWVQKQLTQNDAVYFKPWVERIEELGIQFTIPPTGEPVLEGITPLLTDHLGTYRGSRIARKRASRASYPALTGDRRKFNAGSSTTGRETNPAARLFWSARHRCHALIARRRERSAGGLSKT